MRPNKALGQHWLFDDDALMAMVAAADVNKNDTILEIGPGLGPLTNYLVANAGNVIAVEADTELARQLPRHVSARNLDVISADILHFDFSELTAGYKVVANIPYYLTSKLIRVLLEASNPPHLMALLVQKEVAERITATPGDMSVLSCSVQYYAHAEMLRTVPKELFEPIPKVDSAILRVERRKNPLFPANEAALFRLIKAGFGERRKKMRNSLAGGLRLDKSAVETLLMGADIALEARAQELSLGEWEQLYRMYAATYSI